MKIVETSPAHAFAYGKTGGKGRRAAGQVRTDTMDFSVGHTRNKFHALQVRQVWGKGCHCAGVFKNLPAAGSRKPSRHFGSRRAGLLVDPLSVEADGGTGSPRIHDAT